MDEKLLERAVADPSDVLKPVLQEAYRLQPSAKLVVLELANNVNNQLGYRLFADMYYPRLVHDISLVARAVQLHALQSK